MSQVWWEFLAFLVRWGFLFAYLYFEAEEKVSYMCYRDINNKCFTLWICDEDSFLSFQENKSCKKEIRQFGVCTEIIITPVFYWGPEWCRMYSAFLRVWIFFFFFFWSLLEFFAVICWIQVWIWNSSKSETSDFTLNLDIEQTSGMKLNKPGKNTRMDK